MIKRAKIRKVGLNEKKLAWQLLERPKLCVFHQVMIVREDQMSSQLRPAVIRDGIAQVSILECGKQAEESTQGSNNTRY